MHFSKISLSTSSQSLQKLNAYVHKSGYYYHQLLWDLFSENKPDKKRDFLYRAETVGHWPSFYTVSAILPQDEENIWKIESVEYNPKISLHEKLYFRLRVNPRICRTYKSGERRYFDVVQDAWQCNLEKIKRGVVAKNELMQAAGEEWLNKRSAQHGFQVDSIIAENFRKESFSKKNHIISFSTLDFVGRLTVIDEQLFLKTLFHGIGSAKGFGCGLLMVKR